MGIQIRRGLVFTVVFASGCAVGDTATNPDPDPDVDPIELSLSPAGVVVEVGQAADLTVILSGGPEGTSLTWSCVSSDPLVASADKTETGCRVTGRGQGSATASAIVAAGNSAAVATSTVTVLAPPPPPPLSASLEPSDTTIDKGHTVDLQVQVSGGISGTLVSWTCASGNVLVASVTGTAAGCEVTGIEAGEATVTVTVTKGSETADATATVTVLPSPFPPLQVFFQPNSATISQGETTELGLLLFGGDPEAPTTWTCTAADPAIAVVKVTDSGCEVSGFDAGSTVLTTVVTRGVEAKQADGTITVAAAQGRSQANPASVGATVNVIIDDPQVPWTSLRLTLLETVSGFAASQMAQAWSPANSPPPAGFEYIMARFRVEVVTQADPNEPYQELELNFESVSRDGIVHPPAGVCCNDPTLEQQGFVGASWEGWADFLSETSDPLPLAVYRLGESSEAWFELRGAP